LSRDDVEFSQVSDVESFGLSREAIPPFLSVESKIAKNIDRSNININNGFN